VHIDHRVITPHALFILSHMPAECRAALYVVKVVRITHSRDNYIRSKFSKMAAGSHLGFDHIGERTPFTLHLSNESDIVNKQIGARN